MWKLVDKKDDKSVKQFINLTQKIYPPEQYIEDEDFLRRVFTGEEVLARPYKSYAFYQAETARVLLYHLPDSKILYFGYLEAVTRDAFRDCLDFFTQWAKDQGFAQVYGPVNFSFWNAYRLRLGDAETKAFVLEPWNQAFYHDELVARGFKIEESYISNFYAQDVLQNTDADMKSEKRYSEALAKGYVFKNVRASDWAKLLPEVHQLLLETYQGFPLFETISFETFEMLFSPLKSIVDFSMLEMAFYGRHLVGFLITLPDYGTLIRRKMNLSHLLAILKIKKCAKQYVMLYMAVKPGHEGLGLAMSYRQFQKIKGRKASAVSALIHEGKHTASYEAGKIDRTSRYFLYSKALDAKEE